MHNIRRRYPLPKEKGSPSLAPGAAPAVARQATLPRRVVRTGFSAWQSALAENRSSLYGVTAMLAGVLADFGIDFLTTRLFGKKKLSASH